MTDPSDQDLKALWAGQEMEADPMTLEQIHGLVRKYDRKMRIALWLILVILLTAGILGGQVWLTHPDPLGRAGAALYLVGMFVSCALIGRVVLAWRDPAEPAGAYLRRRLQRQLANLRGGWVVTLLPIVPGMVVSNLWIFEHRGAPQHHPAPLWIRYLPLVALAAVWLFCFAFIARRSLRTVKADLDELDRLMQG